ncbi:MAG: VOC family protein [Leptospiraceae bacterium]
MNPGCFSISLAVKDIQKSRDFYEALGFQVFHGQQDQGWLIMKNGDCNIGLFQGMFEGNILTFNPGWDQNASELESFTDIREIEKKLKDQGISLDSETKNSEGPASFTLKDPDGNSILFDQHR